MQINTHRQKLRRILSGVTIFNLYVNMTSIASVTGTKYFDHAEIPILGDFFGTCYRLQTDIAVVSHAHVSHVPLPLTFPMAALLCSKD